MANGDVYEGAWVGDKAHGRGVKTFRNGDYHKGEYEHGRRNGFGLYVEEELSVDPSYYTLYAPFIHLYCHMYTYVHPSYLCIHHIYT